MMSSNEIVMGPSTNIFQGSLDAFAVAIGLVAIYLLIKLNRKLGGKLSGALRLFNLGMAANVVAITWSSFSGHVYVVGGIPIDIHHFFMTLGMIFFIIATNRFSSLA